MQTKMVSKMRQHLLWKWTQVLGRRRNVQVYGVARWGEEPASIPPQQRMDDQINSLAPRLRQMDQTIESLGDL